MKQQKQFNIEVQIKNISKKETKSIKIIERTNKIFPEKLKILEPKIEKIYVEGNYKILNDFGIAVIGSRNSSKDGEKITKEIVEELSRYNINIISGLALGIDSHAHRACLNAKGRTIAVIRKRI